MNTLLYKIVAGVLIVMLGLAGLPLGSVSAAAPADAPTPTPAPAGSRVDARLQRSFARQNRIITRIGKVYGSADQGFSKVQALLDKARARGLDVSQIQAALDAFKTALTTARPFYDQATATAGSHAGFDAAGNVTDPQAARSTVQSIHASLEQFRGALGGTLKSLREAIRAFRAAHPHATPTPAPTGANG